MPAPLLRQHSLDAIAINAWAAVFAPVVPANRAFVIATVTVVNNTAAQVRFFLSIAATATSTGIFADIILQPNQQFEQKGLVIPAGKQMNAYCNVANGIVVTVHGEEVDN